MRALRFATFGAGYWTGFQLAAWSELPGATCVALYNRTRARAESLAQRFGIPAVYDDARELLRRERLDFVDIITDVSSHAPLVAVCVQAGVPVVCQKPMADSLDAAEGMLQTCHAAGVPFIIHENWRWQRPIRQVKQVLDEGKIGSPFRARIQYSSSFPVFENQPFLKELDRFILTDMGSHILDVARFLFGEATHVYCRTSRVHPDIRGEDVATVMLTIGDLTCTCELSYASRLEQEHFPQAYILIEGPLGSIELGPDYWVRVTTQEGTLARRYPPMRYAWADPSYDLVHASIVPCNANILHALQTGERAETDAAENIRTVRLVFAAYESRDTAQVIRVTSTGDNALA